MRKIDLKNSLFAYKLCVILIKMEDVTSSLTNLFSKQEFQMKPKHSWKKPI